MKPIIYTLIAVFATSFSSLNAQSVMRYNFLNSLQETNGNGPTLTVLGNTGNFVVDTLSEIQGNNKTVYRFETNNGVQFNNQAAGNFIKGSYTIELYFVFDELSSWKRVVDWKNRKTDWGAYVYNGKLNFYSILYSEEAPVVAGEYTYYVVTRDSVSQKVLIYTDAEVKLEFTDTNGDALIDSDGMLNFFYDDLVVPNEASSGAVAMLNLYNHTLDSSDIVHNWNDIGSTVYGMGEKPVAQGLEVYPNPATTEIRADVPALIASRNGIVNLLDDQGRIIYSGILQKGQQIVQIPAAHFQRGLYLLRVVSGRDTYTSRVILR